MTRASDVGLFLIAYLIMLWCAALVARCVTVRRGCLAAHAPPSQV